MDKYDLDNISGFAVDVYSSSIQEIERVNNFLDEIISTRNPIVYKSICLSLFSSLSSYAYIVAYRGAGSLDKRREAFPIKHFTFWNTRKSEKGFMEIIDLCCNPEYMTPIQIQKHYPQGNHLKLTDDEYASIKEFQEYYRNKIVHPVADSAVMKCNWYLIREIINIVEKLALEIKNPTYVNRKHDKENLQNLFEEIKSKLPNYRGGGIKSL